jgi:hypothetical protein
MKYVAPLTDVEIQTLQEMHRYHPARRARMRAHSLLLSHQGVSMPQIARIDQVGYPRKVGQLGVGHVLYGTEFSHEFSHPTEDRATWDFGRKAV